MPSKSRAIGNAHYTIHVPTHDPHGNQLADLASVGGQWLQQKIPRLIHSVHAEGPHEGHPYRHMKILAVDNPETDSRVKQLAGTIGRLANHQSVFLHKDSQQGPQPWTVRNNAFDGGTGHPDALAAPVPPPTANLAPNTAY